MDRTFKNWLGTFALLFLIFAVGVVYVLSDAKHHAVPRGLYPTIEAYRSRCVANANTEASVQLMRPYALVYVGGMNGDAGYRPIFDATSSSDVSAANITTLILIKEDLLEHASFGAPDRLTGHVNTGSTYYRYRYYLCGFDLKTGSLQAYTTLEDPFFKTEYRSNGPQHLGDSAFSKWADSVTDISIVNEQPH